MPSERGDPSKQNMAHVGGFWDVVGDAEGGLDGKLHEHHMVVITAIISNLNRSLPKKGQSSHLCGSFSQADEMPNHKKMVAEGGGARHDFRMWETLGTRLQDEEKVLDERVAGSFGEV